MTRAPLPALLALTALLGCLGLGACPREPEPAPGAPTAPRASKPAAAGKATYVDEAQCAGCHAEESAGWRGSDHDRAMDPAQESTVLGDFSGQTVEHAGLSARFLRKNGKHYVETDRPDGKRGEYEVTDVFGVDPLQQVLLAFPDGRKQAFLLAWDVPGKRWFNVYGDERIGPDDELHWSRPAQNWNYMCAECHATGLVRGWDQESRRYETRAERFDVGCQACHGPGSEHVAWAASKKPGPEDGHPARGFPIDLDGADSTVEIETCARCHARRAPIGDGYKHENRLLDDYLPALLDEGLYHADGQILGEVYEYGSFVQSRMHAVGMRCSDCHDPHASKLKVAGNWQCTSCHNQSAPAARPHVDVRNLRRADYDTPAHHFHAIGGPGSACVDCHAPTTTYMQVDPRRDHSFRVPRPDLTLAIGTPNACNGCHAEKDAAWAKAAYERWWGSDRFEKPHFGQALAAARAGAPGAATGLVALIEDGAQPAIARATALSLLPRYPGSRAHAALERARSDPDPLVRRAAIEGYEWLEPAARLGPLGTLLSDPVRGVRIEAARALAASRATAPEALAVAIDRALAEHAACQRQLFERPDGHLNLGTVQADLGRLEEAERSLRDAAARDATFVPAWVNLADVLRARGDEAGAETALREGLKWSPGAPALHHALGLALVRQEKAKEGLAELEQAARLAPGEPRFGYVLAVALDDLRGRQAARAELERVVKASPWHRDARLALASWSAEEGDMERAQQLLMELAAINRDDPVLQQTPPR